MEGGTRPPVPPTLAERTEAPPTSLRLCCQIREQKRGHEQPLKFPLSDIIDRGIDNDDMLL